ncbi:MAG: chitobiase/beta-hexosaminidase C-terminal domain-containing protein [Candidatus ainarchaeum sp.]|nr:chitobiase/beta-hexosaminidase C-terminal domain-containing protein [Candidatus ainarchaeum sp.]MDD4220820.1 chitobiase/beta-hexosaminidase C-terminal domain-containing protein [Candidatus ainarchaeum sp.]MDD4662320.1 chitobiase/beta-hexosaminidase C-terminal domain-containing protein [Candidatus ainarchaeum sp.]
MKENKKKLKPKKFTKIYLLLILLILFSLFFLIFFKGNTIGFSTKIFNYNTSGFLEKNSNYTIAISEPLENVKYISTDDHFINKDYIVLSNSVFILTSYSNDYGINNKYSKLIKLNLEGDTLWEKNYTINDINSEKYSALNLSTIQEKDGVIYLLGNIGSDVQEGYTIHTIYTPILLKINLNGDILEYKEYKFIKSQQEMKKNIKITDSILEDDAIIYCGYQLNQYLPLFVGKMTLDGEEVFLNLDLEEDNLGSSCQILKSNNNYITLSRAYSRSSKDEFEDTLYLHFFNLDGSLNKKKNLNIKSTHTFNNLDKLNLLNIVNNEIILIGMQDCHIEKNTALSNNLCNEFVLLKYNIEKDTLSKTILDTANKYILNIERPFSFYVEDDYYFISSYGHYGSFEENYNSSYYLFSKYAFNGDLIDRRYHIYDSDYDKSIFNPLIINKNKILGNYRKQNEYGIILADIPNFQQIIEKNLVKNPVFYPECGVYEHDINVNLLVDTPEAEIYYTINENDTNKLNNLNYTDNNFDLNYIDGNLYTGPFILENNAIIKARAFKENMVPSDIIICEYIINKEPELPVPIMILPEPPYYDGPNGIITVPGHEDANIYYKYHHQNEYIQYLEPIKYCSNWSIEIKASKKGYSDSYVRTGFNVTCANKVQFDKPNGDYNSPIKLSMSVKDCVGLSNIYYTRDGSEPNRITSTPYKNPINLNYGKHTVKAIAYYPCLNPGPISEGLFTITSDFLDQSIQANPIPGIYHNDFNLSLSVLDPETEIYYTLNGSSPNIGSKSTYLYDSSILVNKNMLIKAQAIKGNKKSEIIELNYVFKVGDLQVNKKSGNYENEISLIFSTDTSNSDIYYSLDNNLPDKNSTQYVSPIKINTDQNISVIAYKKDYNVSEILNLNYIISSNQSQNNIQKPSNNKNKSNSGKTNGGSNNNINLNEKKLPQLSKLSVTFLSDTINNSQQIILNSLEKDSVIYYTLDGSEPTNSSQKYIEPISINDNLILKARSYKEGYISSPILEKKYIVLEKENSLHSLTNPSKTSYKDSLILSNEKEISYKINNLEGWSEELNFSNLKGSLTNIKLYSKEIVDSTVTITKDDYKYNDLLYIEKIYDSFDLNLENKNLLKNISLEFRVDNKWLLENNVSNNDIIAYLITENQETFLNLNYVKSDLNYSIYTLDVSPISGKLIIGKQTEKYASIKKTKKIIGYVLLLAIIIVLILIILLIIRISKEAKRDKKSL